MKNKRHKIPELLWYHDKLWLTNFDQLKKSLEKIVCPFLMENSTYIEIINGFLALKLAIYRFYSHQIKERIIYNTISSL